jgi:hypothetical protein
MTLLVRERKIQDNIANHTEKNVPEPEHAKEQGQSPAHELGEGRPDEWT